MVLRRDGFTGTIHKITIEPDKISSCRRRGRRKSRRRNQRSRRTSRLNGEKMGPTLDFFGDRCKRVLSLLVRVAAVVALLGIGGYPARAQQASVEPEWQALVTPYLCRQERLAGADPGSEARRALAFRYGGGRAGDHQPPDRSQRDRRDPRIVVLCRCAERLFRADEANRRSRRLRSAWSARRPNMTASTGMPQPANSKVRSLRWSIRRSTRAIPARSPRASRSPIRDTISASSRDRARMRRAAQRTTSRAAR